MIMSKKAQVPDFSRLAIVNPVAPPPAPIAPAADQPTSAPALAAQEGTLKARSKSLVIYLDPAGHRALKLYGVEAERPMQDMILEALETWARSKGITTPMKP